MITANVYQRVFKLKHKNSIGSCFTIDVDSKQYLITAKHIVEKFAEKYLELYQADTWKKVPVTLIGHCDGDVDISVFSPHVQLSPNHLLPPDMGGMVYGQDMYFLGYPFGLQFEVGDINGGSPLPFIKKCILSAQGTHKSLLYLDGHNNPGFSGGPVVFEVPGRVKPHIPSQNLNYKVAAVISGYRYDPKQVVENGKPTGLMALENSGLILAYSIKEAVDLINKNPIGYEINCQPSGGPYPV